MFQIKDSHTFIAKFGPILFFPVTSILFSTFYI